jgi:hypothetical protein
MTSERNAFETCFNASFGTGMLNFSALMSCSICNASVYVVNNGELLGVPLYDFPPVKPVDMQMLHKLFNHFNEDGFTFQELFELMEDHPSIHGKKRTARYNATRPMLQELISGKYVEELDTGGKRGKKFSITFKGRMVHRFFSSSDDESTKDASIDVEKSDEVPES